MATIGAAGRLVVSNVAFLIPFVAGEALKPYLAWYDIASLVTVVFGIILYRSFVEIRPKTEEEEDFEKFPKRKSSKMNINEIQEPHDSSKQTTERDPLLQST